MTTHVTRRRIDTIDDESKTILYDGANLSQLGVLFRMDHRVLVEKLRDCPASGTRNGTEVWRIDTAAPYLVKPLQDVETYIRKMHHNDLPKHLTKEFWAGQKIKQDVEERDGNLWPTERVLETIGTLMKVFKTGVRLMADTVDNQSELNELQRRIIKQLGDGMLNEMFESVRKSFEEQPTNESVTEIAQDMVVAARGDENDDL